MTNVNSQRFGKPQLKREQGQTAWGRGLVLVLPGAAVTVLWNLCRLNFQTHAHTSTHTHIERNDEEQCLRQGMPAQSQMVLLGPH